jgi:hypothetical protein
VSNKMNFYVWHAGKGQGVQEGQNSTLKCRLLSKFCLENYLADTRVRDTERKQQEKEKKEVQKRTERTKVRSCV